MRRSKPMMAFGEDSKDHYRNEFTSSNEVMVWKKGILGVLKVSRRGREVEWQHIIPSQAG